MLNKQFILKIKEDLLSQKDILYSQIMNDIGVDIDGDETDEIQGNMLMGTATQLLILKKNKINKIEEALAKIDNCNYGLCEDCEEEIPHKRLEINPYFTTCVVCAEIREKEEKQRKRSIP
jgi:DnaK suppressor protein